MDVLALVADAGGALADRKAAALAEVIAPRPHLRAGVVCVGGRTLTPLIHFGAGEGGRIRKRKADLRIDRVVDAAALVVEAGAGQQLAGPVIAEAVRHALRPLDRQRPCRAKAARHAAGHAKRAQEALPYSDRRGTCVVGILLARNAMPKQAIRHHAIGYAEAHERGAGDAPRFILPMPEPPRRAPASAGLRPRSAHPDRRAAPSRNSRPQSDRRTRPSASSWNVAGPDRERRVVAVAGPG